MRIEVNGRQEAAPGDGESLGDVLSGLRRRASAAGRVVGALAVDGRPLTADLEREISGDPAGRFARLEAEVKDPRDLVAQVFAGLGETLPAIGSKAREAGGLLRVGEPAADAIARVAEDLSFVIEAYANCGRLLALSGTPPRSPAGGAEGRLTSILQEVAAGLASEDPIRTGDALEHELVPALDAFGEEIREWSSALAPGARPEGGSQG